MRTKALAVVVGVVALAVAAWSVVRPGTVAPVEPRPRPANDVARPVAQGADPVPVEPGEADVGAAAVARVAERCDLGLERACDGATCVSVLEVPALDGPVGWARMGWRSPALVAAVLAGDLGLPDRVLPCRDAIRDLPTGAIRARAAGEGEVWCLVEPPDATDAAARCDALSLETYGLVPGFATGTDRIVELRPPGA